MSVAKSTGLDGPFGLSANKGPNGLFRLVRLPLMQRSKRALKIAEVQV